MPTLLFLAANPIDTDKIRLDEECRDIEATLSSVPDNPIKIVSKWSVRPQDLQRSLLQASPELVHFSGHGDQEGQILLEDSLGYLTPVTADALSELFKSFSSSTRCVFLNACDSDEQARQLAQFIDSAIGMKGSISVGASRTFATSFYQALAYGKDVSTAFELGRNQIRLEGLEEEDVPKLYFREGIDKLVLGAPTPLPTASGLLIEAFIKAQESLTRSAIESSESIVLRGEIFEDAPPPIVEKCSARAATLTRIQRELAGRHWYAMFGGIGTGKTHLAVLLAQAQAHAGRCVWFRLRGRTPAQALSVIDGTLGVVQARQPGQTRAAWYEQACSVLGKDAVLVIDDLPRTSGREDLDDALIFLGRAVRKAEATLITTSPHPLSATTKGAVADGIVEEQVPAFTEAEIMELLAAHGAPTGFLNHAWVATLSTFCRQHPLLLTEAARFLETKAWAIDSQTFQEVISGRYAINLDAPTQDDLLRTVPDSESRELLYRLRLVGGAFSSDDVRSLASLTKSVDRPAERLASLIGLWVQLDGHDRYLISPLASRFSAASLSEETERQLHSHLASNLALKRPLTGLIAVQAITHYVAAGDYKTAGEFFLFALAAYAKAKKPKDDFLLSELWSHVSLPTQIPVPLRVGIRALQLFIYQEKGKDLSFLLADIDRLLATERLPPEIRSFEVALAGVAGFNLWSQKPLDAVKHIIRGLLALKSVPPHIFGKRSNWIRKQLYNLLWSAFSQVKTSTDLHLCLENLEQLQISELLDWSNARHVDPGAELVCNEIWFREHLKVPVERQWSAALRDLEFVSDWAIKHRVALLSAWAQRGRIVVLAEYLNRLGDAVILGEQAIRECADSPQAIFFLNDIIGRQYWYAARYQDALSFLVRCVESSARVKPERRAYVTGLAGISAAQLGDDSAVGLLERAAQFALRPRTKISPLLAASIHTELAFEQWRHEQRNLAYSSLSRAADLLLNVREADDAWKAAVTIFGNFTGYYSHVARNKSDELWPYAKPAPGRVFDQSSSVVDQFDPAKLYVIGAQLTMLAEDLGLDDESLRWARRSNLSEFSQEMGALMVPYRVAAHLRDGALSRALSESWSASTGGNSAVQSQHDIGRHYRRIGVVLIGFALGSVRIKRGADEAKRVILELEDQVGRSGFEPDPFWASAVGAMYQIATNDGDWRTLFDTAVRLEQNKETDLAGMIFRVAALMNAPPREAFQITMYSFLPKLVPWLRETPYATVVLPFIKEYWLWVVQDHSFRFSAPQAAMRELEQQLPVPGESSLKSILKVIAGSLAITLTQKDKDYLSEGVP